jgi:hypothetical protein
LPLETASTAIRLILASASFFEHFRHCTYAVVALETGTSLLTASSSFFTARFNLRIWHQVELRHLPLEAGKRQQTPASARAAATRRLPSLVGTSAK